MKSYSNQALRQNIYTRRKQSFIGSEQERRDAFRVILFILIHITLVFLLRLSPLISTIHALLVLGIGLYWLARENEPAKVIYVTAYISGAEILWRGTEAAVFWEYGKYASSLLYILLLIKYRHKTNIRKWPLIYFFLLVPSIFVLPRIDREWISFNLSGPFTLAVATVLLSAVYLNRAQIKRVLIAILAPTITLAFMAAYLIAATENLVFLSGGSLAQSSAGIGPNQVSSILGLGAIAAFYYLLLEQKNIFMRGLMLLLTLWLLAQTLLTFSRGGFWSAIGTMIVAGCYLMRERRVRTILISASLVLFSLGYFILFPALNRFTGNTLAVRFSDFSSTGRWEIMQADLITFKSFPVFGVGPHQSKQFHALTFRYSSAHAEYTRLLAEHGSFGLGALIILLVASSKRFRIRQPPLPKAVVVGFTVWALLFMFHSAMRLAAPSLLFGLASTRIIIGESSDPPN